MARPENLACAGAFHEKLAGRLADPAHTGRPCPVVAVVFPGADAVGAELGQGWIRRSGGVELRVEKMFHRC